MESGLSESWKLDSDMLNLPKAELENLALQQDPGLQQHRDKHLHCAPTCTPCNTFTSTIIVPRYSAILLCDAVTCRSAVDTLPTKAICSAAVRTSWRL